MSILHDELIFQKHQQTEKGLTIPDMELEIECPRCYNTMELSSDFDKLCYFCQECNVFRLKNSVKRPYQQVVLFSAIDPRTNKSLAGLTITKG